MNFFPRGRIGSITLRPALALYGPGRDYTVSGWSYDKCEGTSFSTSFLK